MYYLFFYKNNISKTTYISDSFSQTHSLIHSNNEQQFSYINFVISRQSEDSLFIKKFKTIENLYYDIEDYFSNESKKINRTQLSKKLDSLQFLTRKMIANYHEIFSYPFPPININFISSVRDSSLKKLFLEQAQLDISNYIQNFLLHLPKSITTFYYDYDYAHPYPVVLSKKNSPIFKQGKKEKITLDFSIQKYVRHGSSISINGNKDYYFNNNGILYYEEVPQKIGKNKIELKASFTNFYTGERTSGISHYYYYVLP